MAFDLMISIEGFSFNEIYQRSVLFDEDGLQVRVIHKNDLIALKKKSRPVKGLRRLRKFKMKYKLDYFQ